MKAKLFLRALSAMAAGAAAMGALLFLPAGTAAWPNGWLLFALLFLPMSALFLFLFFRSPELLEKRLRTKEREQTQRRVVSLSSLMFVFAFLLAGFDRRFRWSDVPPWLTAIASALFLLGYLLYALVLKENAYLSRVVEVQDGQSVVDSGLYALVRHPMYLSTLLMFLSMPLVLGSIPAFCLFLLYPALIVKRIRNEEALLLAQLTGYKDYVRKVRWRLIPFLW